MFGDALVPGANVTFVDSTTLRAISPPQAAPGPVDVIVTNPDGMTGVRRAAFTYVSMFVSRHR